MVASLIEDARPSDATWIKLLLQVSGIGSGTLAWSRYWRQTRNSHARGVAELWKVIRPYAFVHYRLRRDGVRVIDELAVMPPMRRRGLARQLADSVGVPCEVHVASENQRGRAWAESLRFQPTHSLDYPKGRRIVYRREW